MARGNNRGRGVHRGGHNVDDFKGRGRGGRGYSRGRGRGGYIPDDFDYPIQQWPSNAPPAPPSPQGYTRGRGRGRGWSALPFNTYNNPSPQRGFGSGIGRGGETHRHSSPHRNERRNLDIKLRAGAPLSKLFHEDRPFLRPITFVRSVHTATLFEQADEIFQPIVETTVDGDEQSHVPTADAVLRVFQHTGDPAKSDDEEALEVVDFSEVGRLQAEVDAAAKEFASASAETPGVTKEEKSISDHVVDRLAVTLGDVVSDDDDDEIIVYEAPNPRKGKLVSTPSTPVAPTVHPTSLSAITGGPVVAAVETQSLTQQSDRGILEASHTPPLDASPAAEQLPPPPAFEPVPPFSFNKTTVKKTTRRLHPVGRSTPRSVLKGTRKAGRKPLRGFAALGARHEEAMLHDEDPRRNEQRRGDSDIDWGTSDDDGDVDALSVDMGGMELDGEISLAAMKSFVKSMSAEGSRHVTMDDLADIERLKKEDEMVDLRGPESAEEDNASADEVWQAEEAQSIGESNVHDGEVDDDTDEVDEDDSEDDSEDDTPRRSFQARLERLRTRPSNSKGKGKGKAMELEDSSDEAMSVNMMWADEDEAYITQIQEYLAENSHIQPSGSKRERNYMFKAIQNGSFDMDHESMMEPAKRGKNKDVPPELAEQWEKDRQKKAENKRKRALERLKLAADPLAVHKGGKKGRKAMLAAARSAEDLPNRVVDFGSLEKQIRRFLADIDRDRMALPPADKETRKRVHELARAFNLKSDSEGHGDERYTTLTKTSRSGLNINERKVQRILRQGTGGWAAHRGGRRDHQINLSKHREGEEVGKDAEKIDNSNIGHKILTAMGWSEGDRIGLAGGLSAPLTAIMKKTKLGLGARFK